MWKSIAVFLRWLLMGACDIIPWVSGWTIAFITWIYDELLDALHGFNIDTLYLVFSWDFRGAWRAIHGNFLFSLFLWIIVAIVTLATIITYLLETYPSFVWAFFTGLILASVAVLSWMIRYKKHVYIVWLILGGIIGFAVTSLPHLSLGDWLWSLFIAGAIAIIAMLLPWISGSYLLLIMWKYSDILWLIIDGVAAMRAWDFLSVPYIPLFVFVAWIVLWLLVFSRILRRIKEHYHDQMVVVLMWFMLGALKAIRPRKETIETYIDRHGVEQPLIQQNVLWPNISSLWLWLLFVFVGVVVMLWIHYIIKKTPHKKSLIN